jgi:hypothetical protein
MLRLLLTTALLSRLIGVGSWNARVAFAGFSIEIASVKRISAGTLRTAYGEVRFALDRTGGTFDLESRFGKGNAASYFNIGRSTPRSRATRAASS